MNLNVVQPPNVHENTIMVAQQVVVSLGTQELCLLENLRVVQQYQISSAKNGAGELHGSFRTPRGWHTVRAKIGQHCPANTVFVARRPTGEIYNETLKQQHPNRDWILTRIIWLSGLEVGKNRLGQFDTMRRYIYIHGTPDDTDMKQPGSRGCIRMRNQDIIELFDRLAVGTKILIRE